MARYVGYFQGLGRYVPNLLNVFQQLRDYEGPTVDDPSVLGAISTTVLVLHGSDTSVRSAPSRAAARPHDYRDVLAWFRWER